MTFNSTAKLRTRYSNCPNSAFPFAHPAASSQRQRSHMSAVLLLVGCYSKLRTQKSSLTPRIRRQLQSILYSSSNAETKAVQGSGGCLFSHPHGNQGARGTPEAPDVPYSLYRRHLQYTI